MRQWIEAAIAEARKPNLNGQSLKDCDFSNLDMSGFDLSYTILDCANFCRANLSQAVLWAAKARNVNFGFSNLSHVNFSACNLTGSNFKGAKLSGANLAGATLDAADVRGVDFTKSNLQNVILNRIVYNATTSWPPGVRP